MYFLRAVENIFSAATRTENNLSGIFLGASRRHVNIVTAQPKRFPNSELSAGGHFGERPIGPS